MTVSLVFAARLYLTKTYNKQRKKKQNTNIILLRVPHQIIVNYFNFVDDDDVFVVGGGVIYVSSGNTDIEKVCEKNNKKRWFRLFLLMLL